MDSHPKDNTCDCSLYETDLNHLIVGHSYRKGIPRLGVRLHLIGATPSGILGKTSLCSAFHQASTNCMPSHLAVRTKDSPGGNVATPYIWIHCYHFVVSRNHRWCCHRAVFLRWKQTPTILHLFHICTGGLLSTASDHTHSMSRDSPTPKMDAACMGICRLRRLDAVYSDNLGDRDGDI